MDARRARLHNADGAAHASRDGASNAMDRCDLQPPLCIAALQQQLGEVTGRAVRCVQTHISWVLLDGERAWKIKKPVRLGFVDFGTLDARRRACVDELRLNRRLAPTLYLDVVPIRGSAAAPHFGGAGTAIDYAVCMRQFADSALLGRQVADGTIDGATIDRLAQRLGSFHAQAPRVVCRDADAEAQRVVQATAQVLATLAGHGGDARLPELAAWCREEATRLRPLFAARARRGWVREGHGDLHLDNLIDFGGDVTAFDCVEFDAGLRRIDIQADFAFVTMDLHAHGRADLAWRALDRWLEVTGDFAGMALHRYYAVYRALVRAMVSVLGPAAGNIDHVGVACALRDARDPRLLLMHGVSGSGKSVVARQLVQRVGAVCLRSDVERKRLLGLRALQSSAELDPALVYGAAMSRRTDARLRAAAAVVLRSGYPVIVDATFLRAAPRAALRALARALRVPFTIVDCSAPPALLRARVAARLRRGDDASEADCAVLERQLAQQQPLDAAERDACIAVDTARRVPDVAGIAARWRAMR